MNSLENNKQMFNPCHEYCFIRLGKQYDPEKCDNTCAFAKLAKDYRNLSETIKLDDAQCTKPKDSQEVMDFIYLILKNKYGDEVRCDDEYIVIDTDTSEVWISMEYFY